MESAAERKARLKALREAAAQAGGDDADQGDAGGAPPEAEPTQEPVLK